MILRKIAGIAVIAGLFFPGPQVFAGKDYVKVPGDSAMRTRGNEESIEEGIREVRKNPESVAAHLQLGAAYMASRNYDMVLKEYKRALSLNERDAMIVLPQMIFICLFRNDPAAIVYYKKLAQWDPDQAAKVFEHIFFSRVCGLEEVPGGFRTALPRLGNIAPELRERVKEAEAFATQQKLTESIAAYQEILDDPEIPDEEKGILDYTVGTLCINNGDPDGAIRHFKESVRRCPENVFYRIMLVDISRFLGDDPTAIENLRALLILDPRNVYGLFYQGSFHYRLGQWEDAINSWKKLKSADPILFQFVEEKFDSAKENLRK